MAKHLLGQMSRGLIFVVSAPAGTGKTTLTTMLKDEFPEQVIPSISYTTRPSRPGERDGEHYNFITKEEFEQRIAAGDLLEHVRLYGNYYGTSREWVEGQLVQGKHLLLVIDTQGAALLRGVIPAVFIFIAPPSLDVLRLRLQGRQTESHESMEKRLNWAERELDEAVGYDYRIVNDHLETAYAVLRSIVIAETHRIKRI